MLTFRPGWAAADLAKPRGYCKTRSTYPRVAGDDVRRRSALPSGRAERELSDRRWERALPLPPPRPPRPKGGRPPAAGRACSRGIVHVLRGGCRWPDLPGRSPAPAAGGRRHAARSRAGVRERVWRPVLGEPDRAGRPDTPELYPDATFVEDRRGGGGRPDRVRGGVKLGRVAERGGVPVVADRGYDRGKLRGGPAAGGGRPAAPHRKSRVARSRNDGRRLRRQRRRRGVERTNARVHSFRRVVVRHEWYARLHLGVAHLAGAFIALGRL